MVAYLWHYVADHWKAWDRNKQGRTYKYNRHVHQSTGTLPIRSVLIRQAFGPIFIHPGSAIPEDMTDYLEGQFPFGNDSFSNYTSSESKGKPKSKIPWAAKMAVSTKTISWALQRHVDNATLLTDCQGKRLDQHTRKARIYQNYHLE